MQAIACYNLRMTDDDKVTVAVIAAVAAAFTSLLTLVATFLTQWMGSKTTLSVETLKAELNRRERRGAEQDEQFKSHLTGLREALKHIQRVKDSVLVVLSASRQSLESDVALELLESARLPVFKTYEELHSELTEDERLAFHRAKQLSLAVIEVAREGLDGQDFASGLSKESRDTLSRLRQELTETQDALRDSRSDRILWRSLRKP